MNFKNKKVAILGWGINGIDVARYLLDKEARITIFDQNDGLDLKHSEGSDFDVSLGKDYLKRGLNNFDIVFRTPGVYRYLPEIIEAEKNGVTVTSAIKLFFQLCPGKIIGVTGTKGKGTTSTLIYEILKNDGKEAYLAGNIGYPVLELLPKLKKESFVVLELSSFQLIDLTSSPHVSVVLNITTDHLDWHKNREEYVEAKTNIVKHQNKNNFAVINHDYRDSRSFEDKTLANKYYFSRKEKVNGSYAINNRIYFNLNNEEFALGKTDDLLLRGEHNWENITAAVCASALTGAKIETIRKSIFSFKGLEHRLELVRELNGVRFYNDSFSTNPQTTIAAIDAFSEPTTLILGGYNKFFDYDEMSAKAAKSKNVVNIVLIGEIEHILKVSLVKAGYSGNIIELGKSDIVQVVEKSLGATPKGGVVVLSPATSSFDMFNNYKERGVKFKEAVLSLK